MDVRPYLFQPLNGQLFTAHLTAAESGILAGTTLALNRASQLGLSVPAHLPDGSDIQPGTRVLHLRGTAEQIARAEEELLGCLGKPSGVATASFRFVSLAGGRARIVCGAWKKVAPEIRKQLREAIAIGGAGMRLFVSLSYTWIRTSSGCLREYQKLSAERAR